VSLSETTVSVQVDLRLTHRDGYHAGRGFALRATWLICEALFFTNPLLTSYRAKRCILRLFGARVGTGVIIKPGVKIKYPWRLVIGDHSWIGERVWIDNMEDVTLGSHVVISQGAYLCTGNHDWSDPGMPLSPQPIVVAQGAWVGAFSRVAPGRSIGEEAVLVLGAVLLSDAEPSGIYSGNPAARMGRRRLRSASADLHEPSDDV
jgi:putative colanic acid biosynthesis acetyltransferase WcaF